MALCRCGLCNVYEVDDEVDETTRKRIKKTRKLVDRTDMSRWKDDVELDDNDGVCKDDAEFEFIIILMLFLNQVVNRFTNEDGFRGGKVSSVEVAKLLLILFLLRKPNVTLLSSNLFDVTADVSLSECVGGRQRV